MRVSANVQLAYKCVLQPCRIAPCCLVLPLCAELEASGTLALYQNMIAYDKLRIDSSDAYRLARMVANKHDIVTAWVAERDGREGHGMPVVHVDGTGAIAAKCLRLMWRFLVFTRRTGGDRVDLRQEAIGSPGHQIYEISGGFLQTGVAAGDVPDDF